jgi:hypothetical protein
LSLPGSIIGKVRITAPGFTPAADAPPKTPGKD